MMTKKPLHSVSKLKKHQQLSGLEMGAGSDVTATEARRVKENGGTMNSAAAELTKNSTTYRNFNSTKKRVRRKNKSTSHMSEVGMWHINTTARRQLAQGYMLK